MRGEERIEKGRRDRRGEERRGEETHIHHFSHSLFFPFDQLNICLLPYSHNTFSTLLIESLLISSYLIPLSLLILSHHISSHLTSYHFLFSSYHITPHYISSYLILSHIISSDLTSSNLFSSPVIWLQEDEFTPLIVGYFDEITNSADKAIFEEVPILKHFTKSMSSE